MGERKLFSGEENAAYFFGVVALQTRALFDQSEIFLCFDGRREETAQYQLRELRNRRKEEIQVRKQCKIGNG